ncbi:hypothetical protein FSARC_1373 [Fusarium sarcochroum]|uniref:Uncharacterized protein n=1 Tax=Fusarium sarcochroum TaxID=1208366 RepID=A0A8H4XEY0_9HYPO|nr:hypothetical protein FSARC_1373 [Fusarium sarcochroum]
MSFYFQPPIFGHYLLPTAPRPIPSTPVFPLTYNVAPLYWQLAPIAVHQPLGILVSTIRIKVIFHRAGDILASNDAYYNYLPPRETVLANLSWWSRDHGLGDRVYAGQVTLYLTNRVSSPLAFVQGTGPVMQADTVRKVSFGEQLTAREFQSMMLQISTNGHGAFLVVDKAYVPLQLLAQVNPQNPPPNDTPNVPPAPPNVRQPPPPSPPEDPASTNKQESPKAGTDTNNTQTLPVPETSGSIPSKGTDTHPNSPKRNDPDPSSPKGTDVYSEPSGDEEGVANG